MKKLQIISIFLLIVGCDSKQIDQSEITNLNVSDLVSDLDSSGCKLNQEPIFISGGVENLPEWGVVQFEYEKYYPGILDTIKDKRITMANIIDMNPGNGILISILNNHGTFDQLFLCTHDANSKLLDSHYIGKSTMYDNGRATNIERTIINDNSIMFEITTLLNKEDVSKWEMDTLSHVIKTFEIDRNGVILLKVKS